MRFLAIAATLVASSALGQSALPATQPTAANAPVGPIAAAPTVTKGRRAYVSYDFGKLQVRADNSSLNVILRDIARMTGMQIHGGVADQRVFGNYGPAEPGAVLVTLLDGTGVNIFLQESVNGEPASLILTPQTPGSNIPTPDAPQFDEEARAEALPGPSQPPPQPLVTSAPSTPSPSTPPSIPQPWNNVNGSPANTSPTVSTLPTTNSVPLDSLPTPSTTPSTPGIVDAPNPPPAGATVNPAATSVTSTTTQADGTMTTTTVTAPNGVKTPEQIYQQLLQMQKAQRASGTSGTPASNQQ